MSSTSSLQTCSCRSIVSEAILGGYSRKTPAHSRARASIVKAAVEPLSLPAWWSIFNHTVWPNAPFNNLPINLCDGLRMFGDKAA
jgi:hypothetical protein